MLLHIRSFRPQLGRNAEALTWAKEVASYFDKELGSARPTEVLTEQFGEFGRIYFLISWQDWAQYEKYQQRRRTDQGWMALTARQVDRALTVAESFKDTLLETT